MTEPQLEIPLPFLLKAYLRDQKRRLAPRTYATYKETIELYQEFAELRGFGTSEVLTKVSPFLVDFIDRGVSCGLEFRRATGTVMKNFVQYLKDNALADRTEAKAVIAFLTARNRALKDPASAFRRILEELAAQSSDPGPDSVEGKFIRGEVGRSAILFEDYDSDARHRLDPFWLEVGEEACELCEMAFSDYDLLLYATVESQGSSWRIVHFQDLEVF